MSTPTDRPEVTAALHEASGRAALVVVRGGERPEVLEARMLVGTERGLAGSIATAAGATRLIRIAPLSESVCRISRAPMGSDADLLGAAALMAEAELPPRIPPHRRAFGLTGSASAAGERAILLTGWMEGTGVEPASTLDEVYTSPLAALAFLWAGRGVAVHSDPVASSFGLIVAGPSGVLTRVALAGGEGEIAAATGEAATDAATAVGEDAASAAETGDRVLHQTAQGRRIILDRDAVAGLRAGVVGFRDEAAWIDDFALALGAALLACDPSAAVRSLVSMRAAPPRAARSPVERAAAWLGERRQAIALLAAACVLLAVLPLGLAYARYAVVDARARRLGTFQTGRDSLERQAALYAQLDRARLPMTKLLADLSAATPVGVTATSVRLSQEQGLAFQGTATTAELVNELQANLNRTRLFRGSVKVNRVESKAGGVEFDLSGEFGQPHLPVKAKEDFASKPLAERLYGSGASNTAIAPKTDVPSGAGRRRRSEDEGVERTASTPAAGGETSRRPAPSASTEVPAPLTDAEIDKMDRGNSMREWSSRKSYIQKNSSLDAATKGRLNEEVVKLKAQMDKTRSAPPAGAPK